MEKKDVQAVYTLLKTYLQKFELKLKLNVQEI